MTEPSGTLISFSQLQPQDKPPQQASNAHLLHHSLTELLGKQCEDHVQTTYTRLSSDTFTVINALLLSSTELNAVVREQITYLPVFLPIYLKDKHSQVWGQTLKPFLASMGTFLCGELTNWLALSKWTNVTAHQQHRRSSNHRKYQVSSRPRIKPYIEKPLLSSRRSSNLRRGLWLGTPHGRVGMKLGGRVGSLTLSWLL